MKALPSIAFAATALLLTACALDDDGHHDGRDHGGKSAAGASHKTGGGLKGWLSWRGPNQNGTSNEPGLPDTVELGELGRQSGNWTYDIQGRGTPVVANGHVYTMGYQGEMENLQEILLCLDEATGKRIWEHRFTDFITDIIYYRYSISSPTVDPDTGNVFCMTTAGLLNCFSRAGKLLWQRSMMSEYGRLTFPNGRTISPLVTENLVITHVVTSDWGRHAPARDRFYAFDKRTGQPVWSSTPGGPPKDISFSFPVVAMENDRKVLYAGLGGGHVVCVDVHTGAPIWRYQMSIGGLSTSPVLYKDKVIAIHGKENLDSSAIGRMVAIVRGVDTGSPKKLGREDEIWRNDLVAFTSSPVLVDNRIYQTVLTGDLYCIDADSGAKLWHKKLAPDQIHASPAYGDGKLYVPMNNGTFHIIKPGDDGPQVLQQIQLEGNCLSAPALANGRVYVHTTARLYSFGKASGKATGVHPWPRSKEPAGPATQLQIRPADICLAQGMSVPAEVFSFDAKGRQVSASVSDVSFQGLPKGVTIANGMLKVADDAQTSSNMVKATAGGVSGMMRLRVVKKLPFEDDFEDAVLKPHPVAKTVMVARPRSWWTGVGKKWEIRERDGNKVLAKTISNPLFQRTMSLIGHPDQSNYTVTIDILTDGNRRVMSSAGVVNQRYLIVLKGNHQTLEVSSNMELLKKNVRFRWKAKTWYRLKTRVDIADDGSGVVRAKVWKRDGEEPTGWTIEVPHKNAHKKGSPGIYGFVPQSRFMVYLDNLTVTPN